MNNSTPSKHSFDSLIGEFVRSPTVSNRLELERFKMVQVHRISLDCLPVVCDFMTFSNVTTTRLV